ncbi:sugar kinase [Caldimonas tepidiphila]|uniref:sugar kinase n=1 Tax=Caldimonas tepidiphila TaxID=2315841 RepID=UPI000E5C2627|nr:sugar kinase [Caldimonas tepidiphila]
MKPVRRVALFGECMLELQGEAFGEMRQTFGGDTLNTAVYLARCGAARGVSASYATGLGEDRLSEGMLQRWAEEGIGLELVRRIPGRMPGLYLIEVDARGERSFSYWRDTSAAKAYFDAFSTPLEAAADSLDALYLSGISLAILPVAGRERLYALMRQMRERGATVVFDNNYRPRLWATREEAQQAFARAYALSDIALVTAEDEQALHGLPDADAAVAHALALPSAEVVVKRGGGTTLVRRAGEALVEVPAERVAQVVDTTAAGDSFAGGYLSVRLTGGSVREAASLGNRLAATVIQHRGALIPREAMAALMQPAA